MPKFDTSVILLMTQSKEIGEKQFLVFGSRGGQISPLMHIPLWCVSYSHAIAQFFFCPAPWGQVKRSHIIKFQLQSQFQRFLYQTICVFSQIKDIKHIKQDFHSIVLVMPQGWGTKGAQGSKYFSNMVMWHIKLKGMTSTTECKKKLTLEPSW